MFRHHFFPPAPLFPLALCLMGGIVVGRELPAVSPFLLLATVIVTLLLRRWPQVQSAAIGICFVVLGMVVRPVNERPVPDGVATEAVVVSVPVDRPKTLMADLLLTSTGERRRCYIWKDDRSRQLTLGDALIVTIHDNRFVGYADWQPGGDGKSRLSRLERLRLRALQWRAKVAQRFRSLQGTNEEYAVLAAMTLGDKSALSRELRDTYAVTGSSHVLALSGLHLSIIYLLLTWLTLRRRHLWPVQVLMVLAIWAYALLTGLSVSIVRAATMLSIYTVFSLRGGSTSSLGVLSFTAIVMLLADGHSLFDVGFQLSFMALLGILLFMPLFNRMIPSRWLMSHRLVKWLFGLLAVSVAAQLGTAPLVAYYFGRFSPWFLLTNIIVIPAATLILYGALLVLLFPALGGMLLWIVGTLNTLLGWMSKLPLASIEGLHPSVLQTALIYLAIALVYVAMARRLWKG